VVTKARMFQYKPDGEVTLRFAQVGNGMPAPVMQVGSAGRGSRGCMHAAAAEGAAGSFSVPAFQFCSPACGVVSALCTGTAAAARRWPAFRPLSLLLLLLSAVVTGPAPLPSWHQVPGSRATWAVPPHPG
jgi:hypothetical protein